ncbi:Uncharacterised protein [Mycobacteroides abscessus]|nr:Uncharacterised protein [Mycobacteroides abscessus]
MTSAPPGTCDDGPVASRICRAPCSTGIDGSAVPYTTSTGWVSRSRNGSTSKSAYSKPPPGIAIPTARGMARKTPWGTSVLRR